MDADEGWQRRRSQGQSAFSAVEASATASCPGFQLEEWLADNLPAGSRVGYDPYVTPISQYQRYSQHFAAQPADKGDKLVRSPHRSAALARGLVWSHACV